MYAWRVRPLPPSSALAGRGSGSISVATTVTSTASTSATSITMATVIIMPIVVPIPIVLFSIHTLSTTLVLILRTYTVHPTAIGAAASDMPIAITSIYPTIHLTSHICWLSYS